MASARSAIRPLTFCDLSTFYSETGGGVRTYYRAKLEWFASQRQHRYVLIHPGPDFRTTEVSPSVHIIQVFGTPVRQSRTGGYRLLTDYPAIRAMVRALQPDVLETGDPWLSGPFGLMLRRSGVFSGIVTSFYHSDPMTTYVGPWVAKGQLSRPIRRRMYQDGSRVFYRLQRLYDCTLTASTTMAERLRSNGVRRVVRTPFGVNPALFAIARRREPSARDGEVRLLYAGRLDGEKGVGLLLDVMPRLLAIPGVRLTVMGHGRHRHRFAAVTHPAYCYAGYVSDPHGVHRIYAEHDILLAPGPFETFGLSVLEAMAAGLVVVGPDAGGTGELLREWNSPLSFKAGDSQAFLAAVRRSVVVDRTRLSAEGQSLARRYGTWPEAVERLAHVYDGLVSAGRAW